MPTIVWRDRPHDNGVDEFWKSIIFLTKSLSNASLWGCPYFWLIPHIPSSSSFTTPPVHSLNNPYTLLSGQDGLLEGSCSSHFSQSVSTHLEGLALCYIILAFIYQLTSSLVSYSGFLLCPVRSQTRSVFHFQVWNRFQGNQLSRIGNNTSPAKSCPSWRNGGTSCVCLVSRNLLICISLLIVSLNFISLNAFFADFLEKKEKKTCINVLCGYYILSPDLLSFKRCNKYKEYLNFCSLLNQKLWTITCTGMYN